MAFCSFSVVLKKTNGGGGGAGASWKSPSWKRPLGTHVHNLCDLGDLAGSSNLIHMHSFSTLVTQAGACAWIHPGSGDQGPPTVHGVILETVEDSLLVLREETSLNWEEPGHESLPRNSLGETPGRRPRERWEASHVLGLL